MQVYKFIDKNFDQVRQDVLDLFIQSKNKVKEQKRGRNKIPCGETCKSICLCPDGVKHLRGSRRGHGST